MQSPTALFKAWQVPKKFTNLIFDLYPIMGNTENRQASQLLPTGRIFLLPPSAGISASLR